MMAGLASVLDGRTGQCTGWPDWPLDGRTGRWMDGWPDMAEYDGLWLIMAEYDGLWLNSAEYGPLWLNSG